VSTRHARLGLLAAFAALLVSACGYDPTVVPSPEQSAAASPPASTCTPDPAQDLRSYAPSDRASGPTIDRIKQHRVLRIGVSWDTYRMAARNPSNNSVVGFDIDLARAIASALGVRAEFVIITAADRITDLQDGTVDMVVRNMTINCARWQQIAFSAEYYAAGQKVLLRRDLAKTYHGPSDLAGLRVCAPIGTTSLDNIKKVEPKIIPVGADTHTACLMAFQQGKADAITGDDTVLAGLALQDPYADVPPQQPLEPEPYGIGMNADAKDLVAFVNHALAQYEASGAWQRSYDKWLKPALHVEAHPPTPLYGRS
jgi:polar amino acid transport system substrate-binding protein